MRSDSKLGFARIGRPFSTIISALVLMVFGVAARAQEPDVTNKLQGFDSYMEQVLKDWNTPGIGVGIVVKDKLVFAKGYGYRDYEQKLPFTPTTLFQIASNSKLFTAVAAGMLVEEGRLSWDKPVREAVPTIQFYNDQLNSNVTLRDMLIAPDGSHPARSDLVQVALHAKGAVRKAKVPRAAGTDADGLPLQQSDVLGRRTDHRVEITDAVGTVRAGTDPHAAGHGLDHLYHFRNVAKIRPRRGVSRKNATPSSSTKSLTMRIPKAWRPPARSSPIFTSCHTG